MLTGDLQHEAFVLRRPEGAPLPLLVSVPHAGTGVPDEVRTRFTPAGAELADTDWFLDQLYDFVPRMGGTLLCARQSRYVVDLNRPADGSPLYPGRDETRLVPITTFAGEPIYRDGMAPDQTEVAGRRERFWQPYHQQLRTELTALRERFGFACLWDGHSIRSEVPRFFKGRLEALLLGTADGASCGPDRLAAAQGVLVDGVRADGVGGGLEVRCNDTFKGGYITRSSGAPTEGIHAIQLEMPWAAYMDEAKPWRYDPARAPELVAAIEAAMLAFVQTG